MFYPVFMWFLPYFGGVLLGLECLQDGLAKGNSVAVVCGLFSDT